MTFLNQFHKEVTERKMRKIAASQQSPISSSDFAKYMKRNVEILLPKCKIVPTKIFLQRF